MEYGSLSWTDRVRSQAVYVIIRTMKAITITDIEELTEVHLSVIE